MTTLLVTRELYNILKQVFGLCTMQHLVYFKFITDFVKTWPQTYISHNLNKNSIIDAHTPQPEEIVFNTMRIVKEYKDLNTFRAVSVI